RRVEQVHGGDVVVVADEAASRGAAGAGLRRQLVQLLHKVGLAGHGASSGSRLTVGRAIGQRAVAVGGSTTPWRRRPEPARPAPRRARARRSGPRPRPTPGRRSTAAPAAAPDRVAAAPPPAPWARPAAAAVPRAP